MGKRLAAWVMATGMVLLGNQANAQEWMFASPPQDASSTVLNLSLTCPATVSRSGTVTAGVNFTNPTPFSLTVNKSAFSLHLGGTHYVGPKKLTQPVTPIVVPGFFYASTTISGLTGFHRAAVGTIASLGLAFFTASGTLQLRGHGFCPIEVTP